MEYNSLYSCLGRDQEDEKFFWSFLHHYGFCVSLPHPSDALFYEFYFMLYLYLLLAISSIICMFGCGSPMILSVDFLIPTSGISFLVNLVKF